jgi:translation initiation factor eIF-2B subunit alpha
MPVAAIEALVLCLSSHPSTTISETLDLLSRATATLKASVANPISLSAGTDLFQRYLVTQLNRGGVGAGAGITGGKGPTAAGGGYLGLGGDFEAVRRHLLTNGRLFVERAKASRERIASFGRHFVRDGVTVLTNGGSRVVGAVLRSAAEGDAKSGVGAVRFRVIWVTGSDELMAGKQQREETNGAKDTPGAAPQREMEGSATVQQLRQLGVPVATIPESAVAYALGKVDMVIVGAEGVVENGGIISRLGTYQMGMLAKAQRKPFYVVAESHKFVRLYPLGQYDLPIDQRVIEFRVGADARVEDEDESGAVVGEDEGVAMEPGDVRAAGEAPAAKAGAGIWNGPGDAVDFTVSIQPLFDSSSANSNADSHPI